MLELSKVSRITPSVKLRIFHIVEFNINFTFCLGKAENICLAVLMYHFLHRCSQDMAHSGIFSLFFPLPILHSVKGASSIPVLSKSNLLALDSSGPIQ